MRATCIARHRYLSDHVCSILNASGIDASAAVGFAEGMAAARAERPDVVLCDYGLLARAPLDEWEADRVLASIPLVAVSMTRRPEEAHALDADRIAGFIYLPTIDEHALRTIVRAASNPAIDTPRELLRRFDDRVERTRRG